MLLPLLLMHTPLASSAAARVTEPVVIADEWFNPSPFPWGTGFLGTSPLPDKAGEQTGANSNTTTINSGDPSGYMVANSLGDTLYLREHVPDWQAPPAATITTPWTTGFSAPRLLGGIAVHDARTDTYMPDLDFEVVIRGADGGLVYNWTRIDQTLDGFLEVLKYHRFLVVLDNIPYAFVKPENRYYLGFGMGAAPDDPGEFAAFVGVLVTHLVNRYGYGARFSAGIYTRGCHWLPRLLT
jgi:hypothetical protein